MNSNIEWTTTTRGAPAFIFKNQQYRKRYTNKDGSELWVCCNKSCGVSMILDKGHVKKYPMDHQHADVRHSPEIRKVLQKIYQDVKEDLLKPISEIYQENLIYHHRKTGIAQDIPVFNCIRSTAYRRRSSVLPPIPKELENINIPDNLKLLENGDQFVIIDNPPPHRMIVLCSPQALLTLSTTSYWLADGTFRSAPQKFHQSYSIHGQTNWGVHPFIHIAMSNRKQEQYELLFQHLLVHANKNNIKLKPISIMLDFEKASANAFLSVFKNSSVLFCHFHYCRSIWRRIQKSGLSSRFRDKDARRELANLFGLPLIPLEYIFLTFEKIAAQLIILISDVEKFLNYFSNTFLYSNIFPPSRWNHFSLIGFTHRTNNALEGYHRVVNARHAAHPNIWKYILLKRELDERTMISVSQEICQQRPTKTKRKRYRDHDNDLIEAKRLLENKKIDLFEYQRRIRSLTYNYIDVNEQNEDDSDYENDV